MLGLYLYASGAQRQTMTVLSTLGITESYTNIVTKNKRRQRKKKTAAQPNQELQPQQGTASSDTTANDLNDSTPRPASVDKAIPSIPSTLAPSTGTDPVPLTRYSGTLHQLSDSMRARARVIAATGLYSTVYDNINMMFRSAEQIIGCHGMPLILEISPTY